MCASLCFLHSPALSVRPVNKKSFLQHIEDLCANDNAKFQEEFAVSVWLQNYDYDKKTWNHLELIETKLQQNVSVYGLTWSKNTLTEQKLNSDSEGVWNVKTESTLLLVFTYSRYNILSNKHLVKPLKVYACVCLCATI